MSFKSNHKVLRKALIICAWIVGCLIILAGIAFWIVASYLKPERIARIIEKESSQYLDAEISIGSLDYKLFSTYPWLEFEIDSLRVISKSLATLSPSQRAELPSFQDSLAFLGRIRGQINLHALMHKEVEIRDILIAQPQVNIVVFDDSISNFNIARRLPRIKKAPKIDLGALKMEAPLNFTFFSLPDNAQGSVRIEDFFLAHTPDKSYEIGLKGDVAGQFAGIALPDTIPVKFKTVIKPNLPNPEIHLSNLSLAIANLEVDIHGDITASKEYIDIPTLAVDLKIDDVFALINSLPDTIASQIKLPEGLTGFLPFQLTADLTSPFKINLPKDQEAFGISIPEDLPGIAASLKIEGGNIELFPPKMKKIYADDIFLDLALNYNPLDTLQNFVEVKNIRLDGEGIYFSGNAIAQQSDDNRQLLRGDFNFSSNLLQTLAYLMSSYAKSISGHLNGRLSFSGYAEDYGKGGVTDIRVAGEIDSKILSVNHSPANIRTKNLKSNFTALIPSYPISDYSGTKMTLFIEADTVGSVSKASKVTAGGVTFHLDAIDTVSGNPDPFGDISLKIKSLQAETNGTNLNARDITLAATGAMLSAGGGNASYPVVSATLEGNDALIAERINHTPLVVEYSGGGILPTLLGMIDLDSEVKVGKGHFSSPGYLYPVDFTDLDISTNLNRLNFFASDIKIADTGLQVSGEIQGLKPFLTSYSATPLKATADVNFTNVDINQLSWGYFGALVKGGEPLDSAFYVSPVNPLSAGDSVCVLIPRNIDADIRLKANSAEYMQYRFAPLSTDIVVKDGAATLSRLTIGAPYANAVVDWTYSTSRLDNIFMDLKAQVKDFSFEPFYKVFPSLTHKASEITNFTGLLNADISCRFLMFPDMFMNSQSLEGNFDIKGSQLMFARQGKIERITHLMLIEGDEPIRLQNLEVNGSFHDNLLQVNPFTVAFDDYRLRFAGVNNTAGKMYYHIALEKSPFHLPFGVSVFGNMKHPEIRLGGTHIDDFRSEMVESDEADPINVNIMAYLRHGWALFIREAAKYQEGKKAEE